MPILTTPDIENMKSAITEYLRLEDSECESL